MVQELIIKVTVKKGLKKDQAILNKTVKKILTLKRIKLIQIKS